MGVQIADGSAVEVIDWEEIARLGLLRRINEEIMHPLGYAVAYDAKTGVSIGALVAPDGVWTYPAEEKLT